jgi:hypothetical protein
MLIVDFENCHKLDPINPGEYGEIVIFTSKNAPKLVIPDSFANQTVTLMIYKLDSTGKNNLDFHIAMFLGESISKDGGENGFCIMSKDTGFDGIVKTLNSRGISCTRSSLSCPKDVSPISSFDMDGVGSCQNNTEVKAITNDVVRFFSSPERIRHKPGKRPAWINWLKARFKITDEYAERVVDMLSRKGVA